MEIGNIYPREYAKMAYEGLKKNREKDILSLSRCAWAGTQKYGVIIWSGDIDSSFAALRNQLAAGLNMGIAGIPWWTTDIGGFEGGDIHNLDFQECLVRWFEFGTFCPIMRLHGYRKPLKLLPGCGPTIPMSGAGKVCTGADNEVWSYGEENYKIMEKYLFLRERLKPYVKTLMEDAHEKGSPVMRPLFYDYPKEAKSWEIEDQYMFGSEISLAPILYANQSKRTLYLPEGTWYELSTGMKYNGQCMIEVDAPIDVIPVFINNKERYLELK